MLQVNFKPKSKAAKVQAACVTVNTDDEEKAVILARQHCLLSVARWEVTTVEKVA